MRNTILLTAIALLAIPTAQAAQSAWLGKPIRLVLGSAVQEALSGFKKITVTGDDIKVALLHGGSPATPEDLCKRFETFLNERCKGKDASKLRFVVESR